MSKRIHPVKAPVDKARQDWPLVVYVWIGGLGFAGYAIGRIALDGRPHPLHWASGLGGRHHRLRRRLAMVSLARGHHLTKLTLMLSKSQGEEF